MAGKCYFFIFVYSVSSIIKYSNKQKLTRKQPNHKPTNHKYQPRQATHHRAVPARPRDTSSGTRHSWQSQTRPDTGQVRPGPARLGTAAESAHRRRRRRRPQGQPSRPEGSRNNGGGQARFLNRLSVVRLQSTLKPGQQHIRRPHRSTRLQREGIRSRLNGKLNRGSGFVCVCLCVCRCVCVCAYSYAVLACICLHVICVRAGVMLM